MEEEQSEGISDWEWARRVIVVILSLAVLAGMVAVL